MVTDILDLILDLIEDEAYELTEHACDRMAEYDLDEEEVLGAIENGFIEKKQRDRIGEARWVYTILGESESGRGLYVAGKIVREIFQVFRIISAKEDEG